VRPGARELADRFPDREGATEAEQHHRHDERPEIDVPPVSEGVKLIRRPMRKAVPEQKQHLIAGVRDGMKRLGQHRGTARGGRARAFEHREQAVAGQRCDDGGPGLSHWPSFQPGSRPA